LSGLILLLNTKEFFGVNNKHQYLDAILFLPVALNPFIFQNGFDRVYRQSLDTVGIILFFSAVFKSLTLISGFNARLSLREAGTKNRRHKEQFSYDEKKTLFKISLFLGSSYALLHLLEADSYWLLPFSVMLLAFQVIRLKVGQIGRWRIGTAIFLGAIMAYLVPVGFIQIENAHIYGSAKTEDYYSGSFASAIKIWESVQNGADSRDYLAVSKGQRAAVYKVSPLALKMKPYLESAPGSGWLSASCNSPIKLCDEAGPWFPWQLRDAAVASTQITSERDFQNFFKELAREIQNACRLNELKCSNLGSGPGVKSFYKQNILHIYQYFVQNLGSVVNIRDGGYLATPDRYPASSAIIQEWHSVVRYSSDASGRPLSEIQTSSFLKTYEDIWVPIQYLLICLFVLSLIFALTKRRLEKIGQSIFLIGGSMVLVSAGLAIFDNSLGWFNGGMYDLPLDACFIVITIVSQLTLFSVFKDGASRAIKKI